MPGRTRERPAGAKKTAKPARKATPAVPEPGSRSDLAVFDHPLASRYASAAMLRIWSRQNRYETWRRIWIALAESQRELGLPITVEQIDALKQAAKNIDFAAVAVHEKRTRHDVMAHIHAFGDVTPAARGIIHLGATSMDIVDNADLMLMREGLELLTGRLAALVAALADFCEKHADLPCLGFTHLQPAQLTTVGKRAALWLSDFVDDLTRIAGLWRGLKCRGLRGATGTQDSFLKLLGSTSKVRRLERAFARKLEFEDCYAVTGQTYSRKVDAEIVFALASLAGSVHKACNDIRLLSMLREMDEPFGVEQVGSSAMPYKRNPALCERATGLARYLISLSSSPAQTHAEQMLERTLDDSSNKRLVIPEAFLTADAVCVLMHTVFSGLVVYPEVISARVRAELPFIATEQIMLEAAGAGGDRQALHERIRTHSQAAAEQMKRHGKVNDLLERLRNDPSFAAVRWDDTLDPRRYIGLAPEQTREFLHAQVQPLLTNFADCLAAPERPEV